MIYDIDFALMVKRLLPPSKRKVKWLAWLTVLMSPVQKLRDEFYTYYADGNTTAAAWSGVTAYVFGDKVRYSDRAIYECINTAGITSTTAPSLDPTNWLKVQGVWIGVRERIKYNSQKLLFEYVLNTWFETTFRQPTSFVVAPNYYLPKSDIYIDNTPLTNNIFRVGVDEAESSSVTYNETDAVDYVGITYSFSASCFTINVPIAVWTALGADAPTRDGAIRAIADKYVIAGMVYIIQTY